MGKKVAIIANPFSGTSSKNELFHQLQSWNEDYYDLLFLPTLHKDHTKTRVQEALDQGADIVVAAGGDGTVNEVAGELHRLSTKIPLGILPGGSGNGFAMHLGLGRDMKKAFQFIKDGKINRVDTCSVNDRFFVNVSGVGFDARIAYMTKRSESRGFKRYFLATMKEVANFETIPLSITIDNTEVIEGNFGAVIVANATMFGYNFTVAPTAKVNDGLLDVVMFKEASKSKYFFNSYRMLTKSLHHSPIVDVIKAKNVIIKPFKNDYYHIDGEGSKMDSELNYKIDPLSLSVIVGEKLVV